MPDSRYLRPLIAYGMSVVCALLFNLFNGAFSPLGKLYGSFDQSIFYMDGKAFYYGLMPYVDAADVKGILLYWFFRVGYAMSPESTVGCFILLTLCLSFSIFFCYLTANVYLKHTGASMLAAVCLLLVRAFPFFGKVGRAEDIVLPFLCLTMYAGACCFHTKTLPCFRMFAWSLGVACTVCLHVKYNICVFSVLLAIYTVGVLVFEKNAKGVFSFIINGMVVFFSLNAFIFLYLYCSDLLYPCYDIYVLFNMITYAQMGETDMFKIVATFILRSLQNVHIALAFVMLFVVCRKGKALFSYRELTYFAFLTIAFYMAGYGAHEYYMLVSAPLLSLVVTLALKLISSGNRPSTLLACFLCVFVPMYAANFSNGISNSIHNATGTGAPDNILPIENVVAKYKNNSKILYIGSLDLGLGVASGFLPACREWVSHNGAPRYWNEGQQNAICERKPDLVIVRNLPANASTSSSLESLLLRSGYAKLAESGAPSSISPYGPYELWGKVQ